MVEHESMAARFCIPHSNTMVDVFDNCCCSAGDHRYYNKSAHNQSNDCKSNKCIEDRIKSAMNKNYFKVAIRNLLRNKGYTLINLSGLAVGIAACILIMLFVKSEWSYDKFHSKSDRLY